MNRGKRHRDFEFIHSQFMDLRNPVEANALYLRFISEYGLDESRPYKVEDQRKIQKFKLRAPTHLRIKEQYPMFGPKYWDQFILGVSKKIGRGIAQTQGDQPDLPVEQVRHNRRGREAVRS